MSVTLFGSRPERPPRRWPSRSPSPSAAIAVTLGAGLIAGLPHLRALARSDVAVDLSEGARGLVSRTHRRMARLLIIAQVARLSDSVAPERFRALLTGSLGCLALVLASVGVYGVVSYATARMTREIGIRMALGQSRGSVVGRILVATWTTTACGVAVGLASAAVAGRWLEASLPGVHAREPGTMIAVAAIFLLVATLAALGPARRASRVDLVEALRAD